MKVVRIIRTIAFIVFIAALLLNVTANGFIVADVIKTSEGKMDIARLILGDTDDLQIEKVKAELMEAPFGFDNLKAPLKAYSEITKADKDNGAAEIPLPEATPTPAPTEVPTPDFTSVPVYDIPADPQTTIDENAVSSSGSVAYDNYDVKDHSNLVFAVMKYGTAYSDFDWLIGGLELSNVKISIAAFVSLTAMLIAFLLHIISKRHKTVYGSILMIIGFIFMFGMAVIGYYVFGKVKLFDSFENQDVARIRLFFVAAVTALGTLIGLPIYSCGVRQITCKRLRKRLSKKRG